MTTLLRLAARLLGRPRVDVAARLAAFTYSPAAPSSPSPGAAGDSSP